MLSIISDFRALTLRLPLWVFGGALLLTLSLHLLYKWIQKITYKRKLFPIYIPLTALYLPTMLFFWSQELWYWTMAQATTPEGLSLFPSQELAIFQKILYLSLFTSIAMRFVNVLDEILSLKLIKSARLQAYIIRFGVRILHMGLLSFFCFWAVQILDLPLSNQLSSAATILAIWIVIIISLYFLYALDKNLNRKMRMRENFAFIPSILQKCILPFMFLLIGCASIFSLHEIKLTSFERYLNYPTITQVSFFWALFRLTGLLEGQFLNGFFTRTTSNKTMVQATGNVVRVGLSIILILVLIKQRGYDVQGLVTLLGGASFGLSFAGKDIVANYLSGIVMYVEGQFSVGDWIYSADMKIQGTIEYIGIRTTHIRTFDKRLLIVPNSFFSSNGIVNATRMTNRRILKEVPLGWLNDMEILDKIVQDIRLLVYNHPGIDKNTLAPMVHFTNFGTSDLIITIYALTRTKNWHTFMNVQENVLKEVKVIIEKYGGTPPIDFMHIPADVTPNQVVNDNHSYT